MTDLRELLKTLDELGATAPCSEFEAALSDLWPDALRPALAAWVNLDSYGSAYFDENLDGSWQVQCGDTPDVTGTGPTPLDAVLAATQAKGNDCENNG